MAAIKGKVIDSKTGKPLYNATLVFTDKTGKAYSPLTGTVSGFDGGYSFDTLGGYWLRASYIGYKTIVKPVSLSTFQAGAGYSQTINFALIPTDYKLPEVVIHGGQKKPWWKGNLAWMAGIVVIGYIALKKGGA